MPINRLIRLKHVDLLQKTIDQYGLFAADSKILIAISGGPDSVYLAFLLYTLGYNISLAHVNYGLRNIDSEKEEKLVKEYGNSWGIPTYIYRENVLRNLGNVHRKCIFRQTKCLMYQKRFCVYC